MIWPILGLSIYNTHQRRCCERLRSIMHTQITKFMGPTWVLLAPDGPHVGPQDPCYQGIPTPIRRCSLSRQRPRCATNGAVICWARLCCVPLQINTTYRQISNMRHQIPKLKCFSSRLAVVFVQSIDTRSSSRAGAAPPTGDAPTTSEWWTILLHTKACLMLKS